MGDYGRIGDGVGYILVAMAVTLVVMLPLGTWKLIELIIALVKYVQLHWH